MAMMISWVAPVDPSHPYLENDRLRRLTPTICAFHLGFSLGHHSRPIPAFVADLLSILKDGGE